MKKSLLLVTASLSSLALFGQVTEEQKVYSGQGVFLGESAAIRDDKSPSPDHSTLLAHEGDVKANRKRPEAVNANALPLGEDPIVQKNFGTIPSKSPIVNYNGLVGGFPPDPSGAAGPNHYVQAVNTSFRIYDKNGTPVTSQKNLNTLWPGSSNSGDPIVMYDRHVDRWVITQFQTGSNEILFAVSTTPDPTGTYYTYEFSFPTFPDYPKFSIWSDGYYMTSNTAQKDVAVFNRDDMLAGNATAAYITLDMPNFNSDYGFRSVLPADSDGELPPYGTPNYMFYFQDDAWNGVTQDVIKIMKLEVDWDNPNNTSLTTHQTLFPSAFNAVFTPQWNDIEQKGTNQKIDAIASVFNYRAQFIRWGGYNSVLLCNVVDVDNQNTAGIRWYELRQDHATSQFEIYQEGTYAPNDGNSRFLGSIAMDGHGHIGMGYSLSGPDHYPSLAFTGRVNSDPLGTMTLQETIAVAGTGYQQGGNRFGDYAHMTLDPDGETLWYTGEYITGNGTRRTRIFSFHMKELLTTPETLAEELNVNVTQANGLLNVAIGNLGDEELKIQVYAANGKLVDVRSANPMNGSTKVSFDASTWAKGMYLVGVSTGETHKTTKIILE